MDYRLIPLTVDIIIENEKGILLIKRQGKTYHNYYALPGGFVDYGESVEDAAIREAKEEVGLSISPREILGVYSDSKRDPRGHTVSIVFISDCTGIPTAGDDASDYKWISLDEVYNVKLAFDHQLILEHYRCWKSQKTTFWSSKPVI
ncbi:MAG: NUDIX hydrolase [Candidatus Heimdallarchaeota archaeon]|nr:NUDIX hydrolase [Candidatus Heimdallarchaeota archaeon]